MKTSSRKNRQSAETLRNSQIAIEQRFGPIQYRSPAALQAYANNPRKHGDKQIVQLMASITEFGFAIPVLIDETGTIIAGEARIAAAVRLGMSKVPVLVAEHWSKAQVKAYRLADNRLSEAGASWDLDLLRVEIAGIIEIGEVPVEIMGWNTAEIDVILDGVEIPEADPADEVPDAPEVPVSQPGDLWLLGDHRLLCASSLDLENWETLLAGKTAAMAFTDGPFNVKIQGHVSGLGRARHAEFAMASGEMSREAFTKFNFDYLTNLAASSRDGAIIMAVMDWRSLSEILSAAEQAKLKLINLCVWSKTNAGMGSLYRSQHELILILKKGSAPHVNNIELGKHGRYRSNIWSYAGANTFSKTRDEDLSLHPTVKPTALVADAIRDVTHRGEIVLDAFMGSGTTILAAERTRRVAYGIEIEPRYIDVAIQRWMTMTGKEAVLESTGETLEQVLIRRRAEAKLSAAA